MGTILVESSLHVELKILKNNAALAWRANQSDMQCRQKDPAAPTRPIRNARLFRPRAEVPPLTF
jgi:hypothetical protein